MSILKSRRFLPLFVTQFLGAFNDNLFKNALVLLVTYQAASMTSMRPEVLVNLAGGVLILPFFLFSATAGQLADKFERSRIVRLVKLLEVGIMLLGAAGFVLQSLELLLGTLFLLGTQSAFFGPVKPLHADEPPLDLRRREVAMLVPIAALCLWIGVYPKPLLDLVRPDVNAIVKLYEAADESPPGTVAFQRESNE